MTPQTPRLLGSLATALILVACDGRRPVEPSIPPNAAHVAATALQVTAPSNTKAAASVNQIDVSWQDNSSNESRFEVRRSSGGITTTAATTAPNVVAFSDRGLAPGTTYCYDVRAARTVGQNTVYSTFSNPACATTPSPPIAASSFSAVESSRTSVTVSWADNSTNEDGFRIIRTIDGGAVWELAGSVGPNVTSFVTDEPACYRVIAFNAVGDALPSPDSDCTRPLAPTNPSITTIGDGTLEVTWTDNSAIETAYDVWLITFYSQPPWCPLGGACDAGASDDYGETLLGEVPANSTSFVFSWNWSDPYVTSAWLEVSARRYVGYPSSRMVVPLVQ